MSSAPTKYFRGRPLVLCASLVFASIYGAILSALGFNEEGMRSLVRASARTSFVFFVCAFAGPALEGFRRTLSFGRWARENRPYLLASLAVSHTAHALALAGLAHVTGGESLGQRTAFDYVGGGLAYVLIYAMAATSFYGREGRARQMIHAFGMYYVWVVFMNSYGGRALESAPYVPFALVLVAALGARVYASLRAGPDLAGADV